MHRCGAIHEALPHQNAASPPHIWRRSLPLASPQFSAPMASSGLPDLVGDDFDEDMDFLGLSDAAGDGAGGYGESSSSAAEIHGDIGGAGYDPDYSAEQESWAGPSSRSRRSRRRVERPDAVAATTAAGADSDEDHSDGPIDVTKVRDR